MEYKFCSEGFGDMIRGPHLNYILEKIKKCEQAYVETEKSENGNIIFTTIRFKDFFKKSFRIIYTYEFDTIEKNGVIAPDYIFNNRELYPKRYSDWDPDDKEEIIEIIFEDYFIKNIRKYFVC